MSHFRKDALAFTIPYSLNVCLIFTVYMRWLIKRATAKNKNNMVLTNSPCLDNSEVVNNPNIYFSFSQIIYLYHYQNLLARFE